MEMTHLLKEDHHYYQNKSEILLKNLESNEYSNELGEIINLESP